MQQVENNPDCHELRVLATNGRVFRLKVAEIGSFLTSRRFVVALVVFCTLLAIVDPYIFQNRVFLHWRLLFWITNGLFVVAFWYGLFRILVALSGQWAHKVPVPSALMIVASVSALLHFNYWLAGVILEMPDLWKGRLYWDVLRYSVVAIVFETTIAMFVLPRVLFRMRHRAMAIEQGASSAKLDAVDELVSQPCEFLEIAGKRIELASVLYLKSAEHYVEVVLHDATELVRASLRELIDALHPEHGVQPHRSYWVNREAIVGMNRAGGAQFLVMQNGDEIPVSRQRRGAVEDWLDCHVRKNGENPPDKKSARG